MNKYKFACSFEINQGNGRVQLFPYGRFYAADGRSKEGWYVDETNGYALADQINNLQIKLMIDYEHQTLFIKQNGQGNPAAGWIERAEFIPGEGLFADVTWTEKAREHIKAKEYRYISPYFISDQSGRVFKLINAALTNRPALHELIEAIAASENLQKQEKKTMNLFEKLKELFNVQTEQEVEQRLVALSEQAKAANVAVSDVYAQLQTEKQQNVALSEQVQNPDPCKYVALSEMQALQKQVVSLQTQINTDKVNSLVETALSEGKLLPSQKEWATKLGMSNLTALSDYLAIAPVNGLTANQSEKAANKTQKVALSAEDYAAMRMLGMTEEEYLADETKTK
ncbi:hypothetical protein CEP49_06740 [Mergibacter septicus]|uniref:phage protease n=1 Tax=Mergibacter septicus TaxID=221402 RepID=UPI0011796FA6|nr:phage protease [Mergibacter septicus]AWX14267.1 hypothetical protein CEP49_06740 [Mergibacter septicus]